MRRKRKGKGEKGKGREKGKGKGERKGEGEGKRRISSSYLLFVTRKMSSPGLQTKKLERLCPCPKAKTEPVVIRTSKSEQELATLKENEQLQLRVAPPDKLHNGKPLVTQNKTTM